MHVVQSAPESGKQGVKPWAAMVLSSLKV